MTALVIVASLIVQLMLTAQGKHVLVDPGTVLPPTGTRVLRFFSYFTVQSNILVAVTSGWLVFDPSGRGRLWRVLRLDAIIGIAITGLIYVTLLRPLVNLSGLPRLTDIVFHYVAPVAAVLGWLLFGPRGRVDDGVLAWALCWPVLYVAYTLAHGAATGWYPYPFIDVTQLGYGAALRNGLGVALLILGAGVLFRWIDRALTRRPDASRRA